ncbi:YdaS family helix-turn-helix protein [Cupriavidus taiwanensis]|uniref:YdaS family helix-turn-helix protein n=1 Tax=Cupriavidus taiwanensis TaxID=164546 RepID=UPI000E2E6A14|nr:YdaS family helix-turn-helix protein [Cupriavidus taiwanensis]
MASKKQKASGKETLVRAIEYHGGPTKLAEALGTDAPRVHHWLNRSKVGCPLEMVPFVIAVCPDVAGLQPETLRPDFAEGWALLRVQLRKGR